MPTPITEFKGDYSFLSNFFIEPDGTHVEGEYQGMKTNPPSMFMKRLPPAAAKKAGSKVQIRLDWEKVKRVIMFDLVLQKFEDHRELRRLLLATGDAQLIEGNWWGDTYWGMCKGKGRNELGQILMTVREILK